MIFACILKKVREKGYKMKPYQDLSQFHLPANFRGRSAFYGSTLVVGPIHFVCVVAAVYVRVAEVFVEIVWCSDW